MEMEGQRGKYLMRLIIALFICVPMLGVAPRSAYAASGDFGGSSQDWIDLLAWQSSINGYCGLIYAECTNILDTANNIDDQIEDIATDLSSITSYCSSISNKVNLTYATLNTIEQRTLNIYNLIDSIRSDWNGNTSNTPGYWLKTIYSRSAKLNDIAGYLHIADYDGYDHSIAYYTEQIWELTESNNGIISTLGSKLTQIYNAVNNLDFSGATIGIDLTPITTKLDQIITLLNGFKTNFFDKVQFRTISGYNTMYTYIYGQDQNAFFNPAFNLKPQTLDAITGAIDDCKTELILIDRDLQGIGTGVASILAYLVIHDSAEELVGEFDWPEVGELADDLLETASSKMPFSAFAALVGMLTAVPMFNASPGFLTPIEIDWDFGIEGTNSMLVIDPTILEYGAPYIRFFIFVLFFYSLASLTIKFVRY